MPSPLNRSPTAAQPRRRRVTSFAAVALIAAALGAGAVALLQPGEEATGAEAAEVPVPALAAGAQPLGSALGPPDRSLDCRGAEPSPSSPPCAIVQRELPETQLLVPADGTIVGWAVRGASGEVALDVIRPGGEETIRVGRSQWESAGNAAPHRFPTRLTVERGDLLGVELGPGATIGVAETGGATTQRWLFPTGGFYGSPDRGSGTGFDYELLLRADFVPGGEPRTPAELTGAEAAGAADGRVRKSLEVEISKPPATVEVELVEVGDRVALDLLRGERRTSRVFVPDLVSGGQPIGLKAFTYEGEQFSEVGVQWVNPNSGRLISHFFSASERQLAFVG